MQIQKYMEQGIILLLQDFFSFFFFFLLIYMLLMVMINSTGAYKYMMGWAGSKENGAILFSVVCSKNRRGNFNKLRYRKFHSNIRRKKSLWEQSTTGTGCPEGLWVLHPSCLIFKTWRGCSCEQPPIANPDLGRRVGLGGFWRSLPASSILWFCFDTSNRYLPSHEQKHRYKRNICNTYD